MAGRFVPKQDADDVVNTAAIQFIESLQRMPAPAPFPRSEDEFRRRFLLIVRNHALDCVRDNDAAERPVHTHWGSETEPTVGGRRLPDRPLDHVFARNDSGAYDAPADSQVRPQDNIDHLRLMLDHRIVRLPAMQQALIRDTFFKGQKRAEVSQRREISVKTYDAHLQNAFRHLRDALCQDSDAAGEVDRSVWFDRIDELGDAYARARRQRVGRKAGRPRKSGGSVPKPGGEGEE